MATRRSDALSPPTGEDDRRDRSIRPLGTSKRPGRSRTPTPSHPFPDNSNYIGSSSSSSNLTRTPEQAPTFSPLLPNTRSFSSNKSANSTSKQGQQPERRPWFPYPSPHAPNSGQRSASSSNRRISTNSNESTSTSSSNSSSASSYNSENINTRINRRAISAEPEQASHSIARGRPLHMNNSAVQRKASKETSTGVKVVEGEGDESSSSSSEDEKERAHFKSVLRSFDAYLSHSLAANNARRRSFYSLPRSHRLLLSSLGSLLPVPLLSSDTEEQRSLLDVAGRGFKARLDEIDDRVRRNADVLAQIVDDSRSFLGEEKQENSPSLGTERSQPDDAKEEGALAAKSDQTATDKPSEKFPDSNSGADKKIAKKSGRTSHPRIPDHDLDKVRSTIKQYVRDWSVEGLSEREAAYDPILDALESSFKHISSAQRSQLRVLVPGAGLGRLAFEIAWLGFSCQGNEFSFYMLLASHFILNKTVQVNQHVIYPFIHSSSNWRSANDMLCAIKIPDINPTDLPSHVDFSMVAGEFIEVYSKEQEKGAWNAVATCFFIDTAHNLTRYLEVINHALVLGGVWINVGPLLWHYEGAAHGDLSIELTLDEVLGLVGLMGFHIESQRTLPPQSYTGNQGSMLSYQYSPEFWIARKIRDVTPAKVV